MSPETLQACPLCNSPESQLFDQRQFKGKTVTNRVCRNCGLVYQSPRMTAEELADYYERQYRLEYQGGEDPNQKDLVTQRARAASLTAFVKDSLSSVTRHLDIGSSAGLLLKQFQMAYQNQARGVEPGEAYRKYAEESGLTVYPSLEALEQAGEGRFDLISMAHVLEHIPDPVAYLAHLRTNLLADTGHLLIEVPNLYAHESFETAHMVSYSAHSLEQVLQKAGFVVEKLEAHGRPRSEVIPLYLTALAHPASQANADFQPVPERRVASKRKLGMLRRRLLTKLMPVKAWHPVQ
jgi:2-polyprenyl-3-methyl-5-hydroxy-6-metoxy-1,4-benzoquinol methylase